MIQPSHRLIHELAQSARHGSVDKVFFVNFCGTSVPTGFTESSQKFLRCLGDLIGVVRTRVHQESLDFWLSECPRVVAVEKVKRLLCQLASCLLSNQRM